MLRALLEPGHTGETLALRTLAQPCPSRVQTWMEPYRDGGRAQPSIFFPSSLTAYHFKYPQHHLNCDRHNFLLSKTNPVHLRTCLSTSTTALNPVSILKFIPSDSKNWKLRLPGGKRKIKKHDLWKLLWRESFPFSWLLSSVWQCLYLSWSGFSHSS